MRLKDYFKYRPYKPRKILLVDDEEDLGWILKKIMRDAGHKLLLASTFSEGIQKFKKLKNLDMAIIDLRLDNNDGIKFIKKATEINNKVKLIMISAFGTPETKEQARQLGVRYFLDKPLKTERLLEIINRESI